MINKLSKVLGSPTDDSGYQQVVCYRIKENQNQTYTGTCILSLLSHEDVEVLALLQPEVPCEVNAVGPAGDQYASTSGRTIGRDSGVGGAKNMVLRWRNQSKLQQTCDELQIHLENVCEMTGWYNGTHTPANSCNHDDC